MKRWLLALALAAGCRAAPQSRSPGAPTTIVGRDGIAVAVSPASLLAPGAVPLIKQKLHEKGLLPAQNSDDKLDDATEKAIGELQKQAQLPVTGLPSYETVSAMGLPPAKVFLRAQEKQDR